VWWSSRWEGHRAGRIFEKLEDPLLQIPCKTEKCEDGPLASVLWIWLLTFSLAVPIIILKNVFGDKV